MDLGPKRELGSMEERGRGGVRVPHGWASTLGFVEVKEQVAPTLSWSLSVPPTTHSLNLGTFIMQIKIALL